MFLDAVRSNEGAHDTVMPRVITKPGMEATMRSAINHPDGSWRGWELGITAEPLEDGAFDLDLEYGWQGDFP